MSPAEIGKPQNPTYRSGRAQNDRRGPMAAPAWAATAKRGPDASSGAAGGGVGQRGPLRTLEQLEENCAALSVRLSAAQLQRLDESTRPELTFPSDLVRNATAFLQGGTTINGRRSERWHLAPATEREAY